MSNFFFIYQYFLITYHKKSPPHQRTSFFILHFSLRIQPTYFYDVCAFVYIAKVFYQKKSI